MTIYISKFGRGPFALHEGYIFLGGTPDERVDGYAAATDGPLTYGWYLFCLSSCTIPIFICWESLCRAIYFFEFPILKCYLGKPRRICLYFFVLYHLKYVIHLKKIVCGLMLHWASAVTRIMQLIYSPLFMSRHVKI